MPLVLRVDVDKPYGNTTFFNSVRSKLTEDYWFPKWNWLGNNYLYHLADFIELCNKESIKGYFYFRICTTPDQKIKGLLSSGNHKAGMHAENTRDFSSFKAELDRLIELSNINMDCFSKHGSGTLKLGRHHYPPYEPEKYLSWAKELNLKFNFGNGVSSTPNDFLNKENYYPKIFWVERDYRDKDFFELSDLIRCAKDHIVPVLIHPSNFDSTGSVKKDFIELIRLSKENDIDWILLP